MEAMIIVLLKVFLLSVEYDCVCTFESVFADVEVNTLEASYDSSSSFI